MNVSLVSPLVLTALAASSVPAVADSIDDVPTGFRKPAPGDLPTNAWALTDLHPAAVGAIVREAGEERVARLFAIEVAIANGL
ncbi:MAG: hypothetical protein KIS73_28925 [Enhydrobacter sp.]|nr:hypothetical protein [Enhydrobacter sp.]